MNSQTLLINKYSMFKAECKAAKGKDAKVYTVAANQMARIDEILAVRYGWDVTMNQSALKTVTDRMLEIERTNIAYNQATNFGMFPNGQEAEIELILEEWDNLKVLRIQLKQPH
jgi:hypothetical protein